jgi:hypothetical protein
MIEEIKVKDVAKMRSDAAKFFLIISIFLISCNIYQFIQNQNLRAKVKKEIYVAVSDKIYNAAPQLIDKSEKDYKIFAEIITSNMFAHDQYSFKERTDLCKPYMKENVFNYILKAFEYNGQPIDVYYKKFDARTYYTSDSIKITPVPERSLTMIEVFGKQKAVFRVGEPKEVYCNVRYFVKDSDRSEINKFGMFIQDFQFFTVQREENV